MSTTEYSTLHSINNNNAQHPAVKSLTNTHGEVSTAGCPQQSTMNIPLSNDHVECDRFEMGVPNTKSSETTKTKAKQPC